MSEQEKETEEQEEEEHDAEGRNEGEDGALDNIFGDGDDSDEEEKEDEESKDEGKDSSKAKTSDSETSEDDEDGEESDKEDKEDGGEDEDAEKPPTAAEFTKLSESLKKTNERLDETQKWGKGLSSENGMLKKEILKLKRVAAGEPEEDEQELEAEAQADATRARFAEAEALTSSVVADYFEVVGRVDDEEPSPFRKAVQKDRELLRRVALAKNPAKEAYDIGKKYLLTEAYGDTPEEMKAKLRAEVLAELEEEKKNKKKPKKKKAAAEEDESLRDIDGKGPTPKGAEDSSDVLGGIFD